MMLPSVPKSLGRLSDVFISALGAITGKHNRLNLPKVNSACVVMVDGLGSANIQFRSGHAPTISNQLNIDGGIFCGFPSTTVSSLASFATGSKSGKHGMVGYQVLDPSSHESLNLLTGINDLKTATQWQPLVTVSELAVASKVEAYFVGPAEYENSGFTMATMRGAKYVAAKTIQERFIAASKILAGGKGRLIYLYVPELDQKAHAHGFKSAQWVEKLEDLDAALKSMLAGLHPAAGVLLTADHGIVDVPAESQVYLDEIEIPGLAYVGGDPRVPFIYLAEPERIEEAKQSIQNFVGKRAYVADKAELIAEGWFGEVQDYSVARLPELFVIALGEATFYHRKFAKPKSLQMIGQHGSISNDELAIPLLKFGGFAKAKN